MKRFTGWAVSAGLILAASAANAQMLPPNEVGKPHYRAVSDFGGPYAAVPEAPTRYDAVLLPPLEVYAVLRENGFSPLGIPRQRGYTYVIAALDRAGEDGRLIIDARNGQIIRFLPAYRMGDDAYREDFRRDDFRREDFRQQDFREHFGPGPYGAVAPGPAGSMPPTTSLRGAPRPPVSIPRVASRSVPVPSPKPAGLPSKPAELAPTPEQGPGQQSAAVRAKPADAPAAPQAAASPVVQAKPAPVIRPTREMPKVQGLE